VPSAAGVAKTVPLPSTLRMSGMVIFSDPVGAAASGSLTPSAMPAAASVKSAASPTRASGDGTNDATLPTAAVVPSVSRIGSRSGSGPPALG